MSSACFLSSFSWGEFRGGCAGAVAGPAGCWWAMGSHLAEPQRPPGLARGQGARPGGANGDLEVTIATGPRSRAPPPATTATTTRSSGTGCLGPPEKAKVDLQTTALAADDLPPTWAGAGPARGWRGGAACTGAGCGVLGPLAWPEPVWRCRLEAWRRSGPEEEPQEEVSPPRGQGAARSAQRWISLQN